MKLSLLLILFIQGSVVSAQEDISKMLISYIEAIGGKKNIDQLQSIYAHAHCSGPNGAYETEVFSAKGDRTLFRQIRKGKSDYTGVASGEVYWTLGDKAERADKNSAFAWRSHELQWIATHPEERFHALKMEGKENFIETPSVKISCTDELGHTAYLFFDRKSKLFSGFIIQSPFGDNGETIRMVINKWKKFGKVVLPSAVTFTDQQGDFHLNFDRITLNKVDPVLFDIPVSLQMH